MSGWIKLHRKILQSDMYKSLNSKQRDVLFAILLMANHKENKWEYKGDIYTVKPGQFVTSLDGIKENCGKDVSIQNIRTALLKLEKWSFLTNESTKTGRLITIVNWDVYQSDAENQQREQQTANKQLTPNKNDKNEKKKDSNSRKRKKRIYDDDSTYMKMVNYFLDKIIEWKPDYLFKGDKQTWADDFRKLHELDRRSKEDIRDLIDWVTNDQFWQTNIMSAKKLREKFDTLQGQMRNRNSNGKVVHLPAWEERKQKEEEIERKRLAKRDYEIKVQQFINSGLHPMKHGDLLESWMDRGANPDELPDLLKQAYGG